MSPLPETYNIDKSNDPNINIQWFSSRLLEGLLEVFIIFLQGCDIARELATKIMVDASNEDSDSILLYLYNLLPKALHNKMPIKFIV